MKDNTKHKTSHDLMVYAEQVRLLYKNFTLSVAATFIVSILFVLAQWWVVDHSVLLGWLLLIMVITLLRALLAYFYRRVKPGVDESRYWGRLFILGSAVAGIMWGAGGVLFFPADNVAHQMFVLFVLTGMCFGAVTSLSAMRAALFVFIAPTMLPVIPLFLMEDAYLPTIVAPMVLLAFGFFYKERK